MKTFTALTKPELVTCPSCNKEMALPSLMIIEHKKLYRCPVCGAQCTGAKWLNNRYDSTRTH